VIYNLIRRIYKFLSLDIHYAQNYAGTIGRPLVGAEVVELFGAWSLKMLKTITDHTTP